MEVIADRREIVDALRRRDGATAKSVMVRYLQRAERRFFD
jgi:DNA-binding FadR family transcriptional regulator